MTTPAVPTGRQFLDVELAPVAGSRFQPTGFPDLGAATFDRPGPDGTWVKSLLVESAQSIANRLEATAWDAGKDEPVEVFADLPYVLVSHVDDGRYLTSSRTEAHRLSSAFVKDSTLDGQPMREVIRERLGLRDDSPVPWRTIARAVFALDPFCLIHGVFFAENAKVWPGQPRIARALTGCIEAENVREAPSGGVKRDHVRHSLGDSADGSGGTSEGYGTIPYHRTEWTAQRIVASFVLDLDQIRAYGLPEPATALLVAIARWELRALLDHGLRLRTACDLAPVNPAITDRSGTPLPTRDDLDAQVRTLTAQCADLFDHTGPLDVRWPAPKTAKPKAK